MAYQPETSTFPAVYQWETVDPVQGGAGGVANLPLLQLTARTRFNLDQIGVINTTLPTLAPINSPTFTGSPHSVTPDAAASGTEIVTAALLRQSLSGGILVTITGNYSLSPQQASYGIIEVSGTPSTAAYLLFPAGQNGRYNITNGTGQHLLCRLAPGGTSVSVAPGCGKFVVSDGNNMFAALTDFENTTLTGSSTAPTPTAGDNSSLVANTAFVANAVAPLAPIANPSFTGVPRAPTPAPSAASTEIVTAAFLRQFRGGGVQISMSGNYYLTAGEAANAIIEVTGSITADTYLLFPASVGGQWLVLNNTAHHVLCRMAPGGLVVTVQSGCSKVVFSDGANMIAGLTDFEGIALGGVSTAPTPAPSDNSAQIPNTYWIQNLLATGWASLAAFGHAQTPDGYQDFPDGTILQWGNGVTATGNQDRVNFPRPGGFPNNCLNVIASEGSAVGWGPSCYPTIYGVTPGDRTYFAVSAAIITAGAAPVYAGGAGYRWFAVGY